MSKKKKVRVDLKKNRSKPPRVQGWTRGFQEHGFAEDATVSQERVRAKGELSRKRTVLVDEGEHAQGDVRSGSAAAVGGSEDMAGRVLRVHGLFCAVETGDGRVWQCTVRRMLRTLATDERNAVACGDRVRIRPGQGDEASIESVEPRHGILTRASRRRQHVLVANVDQVVIVVSLVEPALKPHLIDRYLASAEQGGITPIVCLNKADLVDPADFQPIVGLYSQLGIRVMLTSAQTGKGIDELKRLLKDRQTVFSGQSGVGKSSLLNAVQPGLDLRVSEVSDVNQKGKHTTTTAELIRLDMGGWVVDTPGIRQFELWDIISEEMEGFFPEFRPFVHLCVYPDCTHTHEDRCAIKSAAARGLISESRYTSYLGMYHGQLDEGG
jgi:ribosome biogenesis GTPase / thiamine phosphate phosphatase